MKNKRGMISMLTIFVLLMVVVVVLAMSQNKIDNSTINKTI